MEYYLVLNQKKKKKKPLKSWKERGGRLNARHKVKADSLKRLQDQMILCDLPEKAKTRETAQRPAGSRCLEGGTSQ